jgi:copper(I)-binding protein
VSAQRIPVRRIGIGLAVAAALLTSACAAGQHAQTADEQSTLDGVNASVGTIDLRALVIEAPAGSTVYYPVGSDLQLKLVIVNNATRPDRLTSITSPVARDWGAFNTTADADQVVSAHAAPTLPSSTAPASSAAPLPTALKSVTITGNGRVGYATPEAKGALLLVHATRQVYPGTSVPLTFTFANAGKITVQVPVALSAVPPSSVIPEPATSSLEG